MAHLSRRARWLAFGGALLVGWSEFLWHWCMAFVELFRGSNPLPAFDLRFEVVTSLMFSLPSLLVGPILVFGALVPAVVVARILMRARLRRDGRDTAAAAEAWLASHGGWRRALMFVPSLAWVVSVFIDNPGSMIGPLPDWITPAERAAEWVAFLLASGVAVAAGVRASIALRRALCAPLVSDKRERAADEPADEERLFFQAVAVTPEARAEIAVVGAVTLLCTLVVCVVPMEMITDRRAGIVAVVYALAVAAAAWEYQRASKIAVGLDGVLVTGTSRTRFFDYHQIDDAEASEGGDVIVKRAGKDVLRLQLHGDDATRRELVVGRIRANIARARSLVGSQAHRLAQSATAADMARAARGLGDYRAAGTGTEELWQIVEAPVAATEARRAAARALGGALDDDGRARLRVAAEHCADPGARKALLRIADGAAADRDEEDAEAEREIEAAPGGTAAVREIPPPRD